MHELKTVLVTFSLSANSGGSLHHTALHCKTYVTSLKSQSLHGHVSISNVATALAHNGVSYGVVAAYAHIQT